MEMEEGVAIRDRERERRDIHIETGLRGLLPTWEIIFSQLRNYGDLGGIDVGLGERFS